MATKKGAYHHGDLRRTLLEASVELILERGLDDLSLREVARRAGVSPAAPYHHFATRQELPAALALEGFTLLAEAMTQARLAAADASVGERFRGMGQAYIEFAVSHPAHFRLMFRPSLVPASALPTEGAPREAFQLLVDAVLEVLEDENVSAHADARGLTLLAWSYVHGAAELLLDGPLAQGLPELDISARDVPALVTRAFHGMLAALRAPEVAPGASRAAAAKRRRAK